MSFHRFNLLKFWTAATLQLVVFYHIDFCKGQKCKQGISEVSSLPEHYFRFLDESFVDRFEEIMVIGDVHGCPTELELLMQKANATEDNVLKIIVGDITRKGPDSLGVLRVVHETPSILTVRGNNEQKVIDIRDKPKKQAGEDRFVKDLQRSDFKFLKNLPFGIVIPSLRVVVVHGGVLPGLPLEQNDPFVMMNIKHVASAPSCPGGYRPIFDHKKGSPWASQWSGPYHVVFGHDSKTGLQTYPLATGIDTGCVYGNDLTGYFIKGPRTGEFVQQKCDTYSTKKSKKTHR